MNRLAALVLGLSTHLVFLMAVSVMGLQLFFGMQLGWVDLSPGWAAGWDLLLVLQFPLLHSLALKRPLRLWDRRLDTTAYAAMASAQVLLTFSLWAPLGGPAQHIHGLGWLLVAAGFAVGQGLCTPRCDTPFTPASSCCCGAVLSGPWTACCWAGVGRRIACSAPR